MHFLHILTIRLFKGRIKCIEEIFLEGPLDGPKELINSIIDSQSKSWLPISQCLNFEESG
jgi:hypothetical protein